MRSTCLIATALFFLHMNVPHACPQKSDVKGSCGNTVCVTLVPTTSGRYSWTFTFDSEKKHIGMMSLLYEDIVNFVANNLKCSICMEIFTKPVTLVCGHNYCQKCISACWAKSSGKRECPHCRADVSSSKLEMNFTLCDILELQDLGGREKWEQFLAETDQVETQHARRTITKVAS